MIDPRTDRVLITGAAGLVGSALREHLGPTYDHLLLTDVRDIPDLACHEEAILADITDRPAIEQMAAGCKALVHLAGLGGSGDLEALFRANVRGLFDALEAARLGGIKRIVFASSNHVFGCYPIEVPVSPDMPPRPDSNTPPVIVVPRLSWCMLLVCVLDPPGCHLRHGRSIRSKKPVKAGAGLALAG